MYKGQKVEIIEIKEDKNTTIIPLPFEQQIVENLFKFEILTSTPNFLILKFSIGNDYRK
jgi:hypothetical protein